MSTTTAFLFHHESVQASPKIERRLRHDGLEYEVLHSNGFMYMYYMMEGRMYWIHQAMLEHRVADWKFHFAVHKDDQALAWNVLADLFVEMHAKSGMKMEVQGGHWPQHMAGREITVYLFRWDERFQELPEQTQDSTEQSKVFWIAFLLEAQKRFLQAGVRPKPIADGDLPLGRFVSLRNETFCLLRDEWRDHPSQVRYDRSARSQSPQWVYPPNEAGWNAADSELFFSVADIDRIRELLQDEYDAYTQENGNTMI